MLASREADSRETIAATAPRHVDVGARGSEVSDTSEASQPLPPTLAAFSPVITYDGDVSPEIVDSLATLAAQEREEAHDDLRAWQQRASIVIAVLLAVVPFIISNRHGIATFLAAVAVILGFVALAVALLPAKFGFPSTRGIKEVSEHAEEKAKSGASAPTSEGEPAHPVNPWAALSPIQLKITLLTDTVDALVHAHKAMSRVRYAVYAGQILALVSVCCLGFAILDGEVR